MKVVVCKNPEDLARRGAELITQIAAEAINERGRCTTALTGGSTPARLYTLLASPEGTADRLDANRVFWFLGDERVVSFDDERSNFGMVQRTLLSGAGAAAAAAVTGENIFPIMTEGNSPAEAARAYEETLSGFFATAGGLPPVFDLVLLGLGDDGHIASLFPGMPSLAVTDRWVVSSPPGTMPPPVDRVTLTFPVINAARQVVFLVAGEKKADAVQDILENHPAREKRPAVGVNGPEITWLLDEAAASGLKKRG